MRPSADTEIDPSSGWGFFSPCTNYMRVTPRLSLTNIRSTRNDVTGRFDLRRLVRGLRRALPMGRPAPGDELPPARRPGCEACKFWQDRMDSANADADRYAAQLVALGHRPAPLLDGNQAATVVGAPTLEPVATEPATESPAATAAVDAVHNAHQSYGGWLAGFPGGVG